MARPLILLASLVWITLPLFSYVTANTGSSLSAPQTVATTSTTIDNDALTSQDEWRLSLPSELQNNKGAPLHRIEMGGGVVLYLLGSSHISRKSSDDVRLLMQYARPDVLFVELCSQRVGLMLSDIPTSESDTTINDHQQQQNEQIKNRKTSLSDKGSKLYANIQADYAKKLNVTIGGEFKQAFQSALSQQCHYWNSQQIVYDLYLVEKYLLPSTTSQNDTESTINSFQPRQCTIILGDRPVQITIRRAWESLGIVGKTKLILALLWSSIKQPSEKELREWMEKILNDRSGKSDLITKAMEELNKAFPTLKRVIIEERDAFMAAKIRQTAEALMHSAADDQNPKVIVAVVGAGHCSGMLEKLSQKDDRKSPEKILSNIVETKKRKVHNDEEVSSLVTDICQFDYSCILEGTVLT